MEGVATQPQGHSPAYRSELEFRNLLDKLPAAAYTCDAHGLITYFNQRAVELWGREPKLNDAADRYCGSFLLFIPDGTPVKHDQCWMARALHDNQPYNGKEIVVERPNGSRCTVLAHANPIHDGSNKLVGAVNVLVDITDRKRAEEVLRNADRRKDEFLATLAHELRSPLAPIRSGLELMALQMGQDNEAVQMMQQQVTHLVRLVDDLLDVSRIVRNRIELKREPVELATILRRGAEVVQPAIAAGEHEFVVSVPQEAIWLDGDPVRLVQVVENLLTNACKYTDRRGRIELSGQQQGATAVIAVQDNGIGIEPKLLSSVFDLFTQSTRTLDRSQGGLGIGLTLVKNLVEMHGGSVWASSPGLGRGSRFEVHLPVGRPKRKAKVRPDQATAPESRRVLVVDDNVGAAKMLSLLVSRLGPHEVQTVHDGPSAIKTAAHFQPDIILLDIGLPGMNGLAVAQAIRQHDPANSIFLVALTGYGQREDRQRSEEAGFDAHLVKPIDVETIQQLLKH